MVSDLLFGYMKHDDYLSMAFDPLNFKVIGRNKPTPNADRLFLEMTTLNLNSKKNVEGKWKLRAAK